MKMFGKSGSGVLKRALGPVPKSSKKEVYVRTRLKGGIPGPRILPLDLLIGHKDGDVIRVPVEGKGEIKELFLIIAQKDFGLKMDQILKQFQ